MLSLGAWGDGATWYLSAACSGRPAGRGHVFLTPSDRFLSDKTLSIGRRRCPSQSSSTGLGSGLVQRLRWSTRPLGYSSVAIVYIKRLWHCGHRDPFIHGILTEGRQGVTLASLSDLVLANTACMIILLACVKWHGVQGPGDLLPLGLSR